MVLAEQLKPLLAQLADSPTARDDLLNKQLKFLELYVERLTGTGDQGRVLLKASGPYVELCCGELLEAFKALGFRETEASWVYEGDLEALGREKEALSQLFPCYRRYSLEEISQYVARNEKPPGIRDIDDKAVEAQHSASQLVALPKPWQEHSIAAFDFDTEAESPPPSLP
jgi:hypothetical protein